MAAPEVKKVAQGMAGLRSSSVDTERHPDIAARYGVQGIPNFVVLKDGRPVFQQAGVAPRTRCSAGSKPPARDRLQGRLKTASTLSPYVPTSLPARLPVEG